MRTALRLIPLQVHTHMESKGSEAEVINSECNRQKTRLTVRGDG